MEIEEEIEERTEREVVFKISSDEVEIYFQLSEEERDLLENYIVDEIYFDDDAEPSYLVLRFRKRERNHREDNKATE